MGSDKELDAMAAIAKAIDQFSKEEIEIVQRILQWAVSRYSVKIIGAREGDIGKGGRGETLGEGTGGAEFGDIADLFHTTAPKTDPERALIAGYWFTTEGNKLEFSGQEVNSSLKNLGHGASNITDALTSLMRRKPSLVMQTAKSGSSRQARKKYKLTRAGLEYVRRMTSVEGNTSQE